MFDETTMVRNLQWNSRDNSLTGIVLNEGDVDDMIDPFRQGVEGKTRLDAFTGRYLR